MIIEAVEGYTANVSAEFLDDVCMPVKPAPGYPKVAILENADTKDVKIAAVIRNREIISSSIASPTEIPGVWSAMLAIPMLGLERPTKYTVSWKFLTQDNERYSLQDTILISPKKEKRDRDVVLLGKPTSTTKNNSYYDLVPKKAYVNIPNFVDVNYPDQNIIIYDNNDIVQAIPLTECVINSGDTKSTIEFTPELLDPLMSARHMECIIYHGGRYNSYSYNIWFVTPQIRKAADETLKFLLDKAYVGNVIAALEWNYADMMGYLELGLNHFNLIGEVKPFITNFTGLNMQGVLFNCWVYCSAYIAAKSQALAEGMLAFDFSGQGISLSVDRRSVLDDFASWLGDLVDKNVMPVKKQLAQNGILGGDGSEGATTLRNAKHVGMLGLTNIATTHTYTGWYRRWRY